MSNASKIKPLFSAHPSLRQDVLWIASVALIYFAVARLSLLLVFQPEGIAAIWPPAGIFLSAILLTRRNVQPWLIGTLFVTDFIAERLAGTPWLVCLIYALVLTGEAIFSAWLLKRLVGLPITLRRVRELAGWLLLSIILSNALASLVAATAAALFLPGTSFWEAWKWWMASDGAGNLVITPLILSWAAWGKARPSLWNPKRLLEGAALIILVALLNYIAFARLSEYGLFSILLTYLTFPFLVWAALRFGVRGVASAALVMAAITIYFASTGHVTNDLLQGSPLNVMITVQLFLAIMVMPALFLATVVSERKMVEEALRESEDKFKYVFEYSTVGKSITLPSGEIRVNGAFCEMLDYSPQELQGKKWQDITYPDDIEMTQREINSLLSGEKNVARFTKRFLRKNGLVVWSDVSSSLRRDKQGRPLYLMTTAIDITERIRAEAALHESEERFRLLFDQAPLGYQSLGSDGKFIDVNLTWLDNFGYSREEVLGHWFVEFLAPEYVEVFRQHFLTFKATGQIHCEVEMLHKNGSRHFVVFEGRIGYDLNRNFKQTHCILQDITQQKIVEEKVAASQKLLQDLTDNSAALIYAIDAAGRFLLINHSLEAVLGVPRETIIGKTRADILPTEVAAAHRTNDLQVIATRQSITFEEENNEHGGMHTYLSVKFPLLDLHGQVYGIGGISTDITERKLAEVKVNEQLDELRRWQDATLGREDRLLDLKREVNELLTQSGLPSRYPSAEVEKQ